ERPTDVHGEITDEAVARLFGEGRLARGSGVVVQDVDRAVLLLNLSDQPLNAVRIARVHLASVGLVPLLHQPFGQLLRLGGAPSGQNHLETLLCKAFGGRKPHSRSHTDAEKCLHLLSPFDTAAPAKKTFIACAAANRSASRR